MKDQALRLALEVLVKSRVFVTTREKIKHPEGTDWYDEAIAAIQQASEQPEPEPVAEVVESPPINGATLKAAYLIDKTLPAGTKLYASPPKREWQGLTDVDVSKILDEQNGFYTFEKCFNFAKAIEAKLKERNT
jgi:hypothetical protein